MQTEDTPKTKRASVSPLDQLAELERQAPRLHALFLQRVIIPELAKKLGDESSLAELPK